MREILFRGKRKINKEWIYGDYFRSKIFNTELGIRVAHSITYYHNDIEHSHVVDPSTIGQYTGLPDLHNNPIFEGDIVKGVCYAGKTEGIVTFKNGYYYIHAYAGYCEQLNRCSHMVEIIGNIHDNPDLLEDKL